MTEIHPGESLCEFIDRTICGEQAPAWSGTITLDPDAADRFFPPGTVIYMNPYNWRTVYG